MPDTRLARLYQRRWSSCHGRAVHSRRGHSSSGSIPQRGCLMSAHVNDKPSFQVVVSGQGWVTALGTSVEDVWQRLAKGESGIAPCLQYLIYQCIIGYQFLKNMKNLNMQLNKAPWCGAMVHVGVFLLISIFVMTGLEPFF